MSVLTNPGSDLLIVARTDSEAATLLTSTIDPRDHSFILGVTNPALQPLNDLMIVAEHAGQTGDQLQKIEDQWITQAGIKLFDEAVVDIINSGVHVDKQSLISEYLSLTKGKSNSESRAIAKGLTGVDIYWNWDSPRTREGFYRYRGGCGCAINRANAYVPYADMLWMESKLPDYEQAKEFANGVHALWPEQKYAHLPFSLIILMLITSKNNHRLAYNLSPSFNWKTAMDRDEQETYIKRLAKLGYCWQFITLAGLHTSALISDQFSKAFAKHGMRAYGELVQEPEMENKIDVVRHQKWSGANYVDNMLKMVTGGISSTSAMGKGVTEEQFK